MKKFASLFLCAFTVLSAAAQSTVYPQGYFRNPVDLPMLLAGNFGECRPDHFHSGLDIKTAGVENKPVYAAADGYISRVKLDPNGFGHAIYITHPNGYITLYAHLNNFFPALQKMVHVMQYERKNWELDEQFAPTVFPVKKGDFIAFSGNTGGSTAPHLHFEIRAEKTGRPVNPQLFGFDIKDHIPPKPSGIVIYQKGKSIYEQVPVQAALRQTNVGWRCDALQFPGREFNIGIAVNDFMDSSKNTLAVYSIEWAINGKPQGKLVLDDIGYDETRYLNACADYKIHRETGVWYNSLFSLPGNKLGRIYQLNTAYDVFRDTNIVDIKLTDDADNIALVQAVVIRTKTENEFVCNNLVKAGEPLSFEQPGVSAKADKKALYDDICLFYESTPNLPNAVSAQHQIHKASIPLHTPLTVSLQPNVAVPFELTNKLVMVCQTDKGQNGKGTQKVNEKYTATFKSFGKFWLSIDTTAPTIALMQQNTKELRLKVTESGSSVAKFKGETAQGQWLCFEKHGDEFFYVFDEKLKKGIAHKITFYAEDESGNSSAKTFTVTPR